MLLFPHIRVAAIQMARSIGAQGHLDETELADQILEKLQQQFDMQYLDTVESQLAALPPRAFLEAVEGDRDAVSMPDGVREVLSWINAAI